jgi:polyhydroxybutyrate depolymerase
MVKRAAALLGVSLMAAGALARPARSQDAAPDGDRARRIRSWSLERMREAEQARAQDPLFTLLSGGRTRDYVVHFPAERDRASPLPVVVYLHGGAGSSRAAYLDRMNEAADRLGFLLVSPDGTGPISGRLLVWNSGAQGGRSCCGYAVENAVDDVAFASAMLSQVERDFKVDRRRVYVAGISNGGSMAYRLACELSPRIAAAATVAGWTEDSCRPQRPVPVLHIHGTGDLMSPYLGGETGQLLPGLPPPCVGPDRQRVVCTAPSAARRVEQWVELDRCTEAPVPVFEKGAARCESYRKCAAGAEVEFCTIKGGGHAWPSGFQYAPVAKIGPVTQDLSFDQIWDFFRRHSLP